MNKSEAVVFLGHCGVHPSKIITTKDWVRAPCPLASWTHDSGKDSSPSFAVKVNDHGESHFHCFTCRSGDCMSLLEALSSFGASKPRYNIANAMDILVEEGTNPLKVEMKDYGAMMDDQIYVWPEDWLESFSSVYKIPRAIEYLKSRGVSGVIAGALDLRYDSGRGAIAFPIRDWLGDLVGMRSRRIVPGDKPPYYVYKYKGHHSSLPWYGEHFVDIDRPVLMVESVFDLASVYRVYPNVLAPLTVGMSKDKITRVNRALEVVTLFDNGVGGDRARKLISKWMPDSIITHLNPPDEFSDPGDMSQEDVRRALHHHLPL